MHRGGDRVHHGRQNRRDHQSLSGCAQRVLAVRRCFRSTAGRRPPARGRRCPTGRVSPSPPGPAGRKLPARPTSSRPPTIAPRRASHSLRAPRQRCTRQRADGRVPEPDRQRERNHAEPGEHGVMRRQKQRGLRRRVGLPRRLASPPASWVATTANRVPPMATTRNCTAPPQAPAIEPPITPASDGSTATTATQAKKTQGMPLAVLSGTLKPASASTHPPTYKAGTSTPSTRKRIDSRANSPRAWPGCNDARGTRPG